MKGSKIPNAQRNAFMRADKIAVIGMPLAGKTTIINEMNGYDLDDIVENLTQQKIPDLLAAGSFRQAETKALTHLIGRQSSLIALGGGAVLKQENLDALRDYFVVFLDTPLSVLHERLKKNDRPLIQKPADLDQLFFERYPLYAAAARMHVDGETLRRLLKEKMGQ